MPSSSLTSKGSAFSNLALASLKHSEGGSPRKLTMQGSEPHAYTLTLAAAKERRLAQELSGKWVGPIPVPTFLDEFLSVSNPRYPKPRKAVKWKSSFSLSKFKQYTSETEMYPPLENIITDSGALFSLKIVDTSRNPDVENYPGMKNHSDMMLYDKSVDTSLHPTQFEVCELVLEIKAPLSIGGESIDPFEDHPAPTTQPSTPAATSVRSTPTASDITQTDISGTTDAMPAPPVYPFEPSEDLRLKCRGQLAGYARIMLARQFRTHCFIVWLGDPYARLIRFDRDGAMVTERFNYRQNGDLLLEFLWRFENLSDAARGKDPTAELVNAAETEIAHEVLEAYPPKGGKKRSVYKLRILDPIDPEACSGKEEERSYQSVLVWGALAEPVSATGRATKGYPAVRLPSKELVFVKDAWRNIAEGMEKETEIIKRLNEKNVSHVPIYLGGDDLEGPFQKTVTKDYINETWNIGGMIDHLEQRGHIRFMTDKVGKPLESFSSPKELLFVIRCALIAHQEAFNNCDILHRDISFGNIMIYLNQAGSVFGLLNDWDMARAVKDLGSGPRQLGRSGTWQFMSYTILRYPNSIHTIHDDIESFFWVLLYVILRYTSHSLAFHLKDVIKDIFEENQYNSVTGQHLGGRAKMDFLTSGGTTYGKLEMSIRPLTKMFRDFRGALADLHWYFQSVRFSAECLMGEDPNHTEESAMKAAIQSRQDRLKLLDHAAALDIIDMALADDNWPTDMKPACDNFPKAGAGTGSKGGVKRSVASEGDGSRASSAKRARSDTPPSKPGSANKTVTRRVSSRLAAKATDEAAIRATDSQARNTNVEQQASARGSGSRRRS